MTYIADLKQGVVREKAKMEKPDSTFVYSNEMTSYRSHLASLKTYPILPSDHWVDGWEYPESWIEIVPSEEVAPEVKTRAYARLKQQPIETQEEMWMDVYQSTNDDNYDRWEDRIKSKYTITRK